MTIDAASTLQLSADTAAYLAEACRLPPINAAPARARTRTSTVAPPLRAPAPTEPGAPLAEPLALGELRALLEAHLEALRAIYEEQRRTVQQSLAAVDGLRHELAALADPRAPWIAALVASRDLIREGFLEVARQTAGLPRPVRPSEVPSSM